LCPDPESVQIALSELMLNAIEHGNLGLGFARKGQLMAWAPGATKSSACSVCPSMRASPT
jgi:hypothetical protein